MALTSKQEEVYKYLVHFRDMFGYMPTTRDIQSHFGYKSQTAAMHHLISMERQGYIQRHSRKARAITITKKLEP